MGQPQPKNHYTEDEMRREIISTVARLDKSFLRVVHSMMRTYSEELKLTDDPVVAHTINGEPLRETAFFDGMDQSLEEAREGSSRSVEEVFKEKTEWLKSIK